MERLLETERLVLRRFTAADLDNLCDLNGDPEVMRFLTGGTPTPRHVIETEILPLMLRSYSPVAGFGYWVVVERASGAFLGWISLRPPAGASPDGAELGYRLRKAAWGRGYATEVARALIGKAFADLGVQRVFATTYQDNLASRRVMEKLGMTLVRTFRMTEADLLAQDTSRITSTELWDGEDVEYALERADWKRQAGHRVTPAAGAPQSE